ncbi:MAG: DUF1015 domain-containing protein [Victivallales bacterium]|nr:DUF1015 domain-containing protein [Victivallales bacterium]
MSTVLPFQAIMPSRADAPSVATLPYDVMNRDEAAKMAAGKPLSFLHVTRSEIDLPADTNPYSPEVYEKAAQNWNALKKARLAKDAVPAFYIYSLVMNGRRQTGIVATPTVKDYDTGVILKHENTRKEKEDDRTRHISTLRAQTGPVFLTYKDSPAIDAIVMKNMATTPLFDFTAEDGIQHTGWRIEDEDTNALKEAFAQIPNLYIADGHHRAASASRANATLKDGESDRFMAVIFPASQLKILPYNRVVFDLNGMDEAQFLAAVRSRMTVEPVTSAEPNGIGDVRMYLAGKWWKLTLPELASASAIDALDVSRLQNTILAPLLAIEDPRTSKRIDFVGGIRGTGELEKRVNSGEAKVAFSMFATTLDQLMAIADAGGIMPPKSTWFEPKLRDGLFVHEI